jgi:hypothetical protein
MYSSLGHRLVPNNLLNVDTTHEATRFLPSSVSDWNRLNHNGKSESATSKSITSFILLVGICSSIVSTNSPCGSNNAKPFHVNISLLSIFAINVDLPVHVLPTIYICLNLSSFLIPNLTLSHL